MNKKRVTQFSSSFMLHLTTLLSLAVFVRTVNPFFVLKDMGDVDGAVLLIFFQTSTIPIWFCSFAQDMMK